MKQNYQRALDLGIAITTKFRYGSPEFIKGEKIIAWACAKNRDEELVELETRCGKPHNNGDPDNCLECGIIKLNL